MDKDEIIRASKNIFNQFTDTCLQIPDEIFFLQPTEKWSIAQITTAKKFPFIQKWQRENEKYLESLELRWSDRQLDQYLAPHPLLGKLTLRELCYFTIYHTGHHLDIIKVRLTEQLN